LICVSACVSPVPAAAKPASAAASTEPARTFPDLVYSRTPEKALHLDYYLNRAALDRPGPVLVYFHGGGWARGAPPETSSGFKSYLKQGFSVVTVEYRLAGEAPAPAAVQDARCALHWLNLHAEKLRIDPTRIVLLGTSAGGHLALMAGLLPEGNAIDPEACQNVPKAAAIIDMYGPADLTKLTSRSGGRHSTIVNWTGAGENGEELERLLSPARYVSPDAPPVYIVHGNEDPIVPVEQSIELARLLKEANVPHELSIIEGGKHGKFSSDDREAVQHKIEAFLRGLKIIR
jgi:acetyl esterase/lipase